MSRFIILFILFVSLIAVITTCGGGGGGGGGGGNTLQPPTYNASGIWHVTETNKNGNCTQLSPLDSFDLSVNHPTGSNSLVVTDVITTMQYNGTISGSTVNYSGPGVDSNCTGGMAFSVTMTMSSDTLLSGSANWTCNYAGGSCSGTTAFTAVKEADVTPPTAPTGLTGTVVSSSQIDLSWTASTDNVGVTVYRLERCQGVSCSNFSQIATSTTNSYSNTGLTASTSYSYRVRAVDAAGNISGYSNTYTDTTQSGGSGGDTTPPTPPTNLTGTVVSISQINLSWTASTDNVAVTGYRLERCQGASCSNFSQITTPATNSWNDTGLTASTSYTYRVRAVDAAVNLSGYSNMYSTTTQGGGDTQAPTVPTNLIATPVSTSQIDLSWSASTDNVGVAGYKVYGVDNSGSTRLAKTVTGTSTSMTGLDASVQYCYKVSAYDATYNQSGKSVVACATTVSGAQTIVLTPQYDNLVMKSSLGKCSSNSNIVCASNYDCDLFVGSGTCLFAEENSVYQNAYLAVGTNWTYDIEIRLQQFVAYQSLVQFNTSSLAGKTIDSATLHLVTYSCGVGYYPRQWHIRALSTSWSPATVTWNITENLQYYLNSQITLYPPCFYGQGQTFDINVTSIVQNWASGSWNKYGLIFGSEDYTFPYYTSFDAFEFYSRENSGQEPKLTVMYH